MFFNASPSSFSSTSHGNIYRDRSKPFLSVLQTLTNQQKFIKKQHDDEENLRKASSLHHHQSSSPPSATDDDNAKNTPDNQPDVKQEKSPSVENKEQVPDQIHIGGNTTQNTKQRQETRGYNEKQESLDRDDNNNNIHHQEESSTTKTDDVPSYIRRFDIKGLDRYPLTEQLDREEKAKKGNNNNNNNTMAVGTSDDPFRSKLASLIHQKNCLLGHQNLNPFDGRRVGNLNEKEQLMDELLTLRESLGVLQQMVNSGVDVNSNVVEEDMLADVNDQNSSSTVAGNDNDHKKSTQGGFKGDVIKISLAPTAASSNPSSPSKSGNSNKKATSSTATSTEDEVRNLSKSSSSTAVPYSKFAKKR